MSSKGTREYTVIRIRANAYVVEIDGAVAPLGLVASVKVAHRWCAENARLHGHNGAGLTETFGRNRQFVLGPRGGWKRHIEGGA